MHPTLAFKDCRDVFPSFQPLFLAYPEACAGLNGARHLQQHSLSVPSTVRVLAVPSNCINTCSQSRAFCRSQWCQRLASALLPHADACLDALLSVLDLISAGCACGSIEDEPADDSSSKQSSINVPLLSLIGPSVCITEQVADHPHFSCFAFDSQPTSPT
jgi:hypothetical protein